MRAKATTIALCLALVSAQTVCAAARAPSAPWWHNDWQYRLAVRVVPATRRGGINTAMLNLTEQSALCAADGQDIRIIDEHSRAVPHQVAARDDKTLDVKFVVPADAELFYVYYGNPNAPPVKHTWQEQLGGLYLETRALTASASRAAQIPTCVQTSVKSFGRQPWAQINDLQNPFGPEDMYISIYEGTLYCPEDGEYWFSMNADDIAVFYIEVAGQVQSICWRDAGVPSEDWPFPGMTNFKSDAEVYASATKQLDRGVYRIQFYHIENTGAQLAKLGWKEPSSDAIVTVPPRAFVKYLPAEVDAREKRGEALNPFFAVRHRYNLAVNSDELLFPSYRFENCTTAPPEMLEKLTFRWDFADGLTALGAVVDHEFPDMKTYDVTLTVHDAEGKEFSVKRPVSPAPEPLKQMSLNMQVEFESKLAVLPADGKALMQLFLQNDSSVQRSIAVQILQQSVGLPQEQHKVLSEDMVTDLVPSRGEERDWYALRKEIALPAGNVLLTYRLLLHGRPVLQQDVSALSTASPLGELSQDSAHNLRDARGHAVALRLADIKLTDAPPRVLCDERTGRVKVLVMDDGLGGAAEAKTSNFATMLAGSLENSYKGLKFEVERPTLRRAEEYPPIQRFLEIYTHARKTQPNIVILICQPESVVNTVPLDAFETYLVAAIDQILSQTRAHVVVVTPPPLPGRPELSLAYARVAKKAGLRKGLVVADLYSRFMLTPDWRDLFKAGRMEQQSYLLYPNEKGQWVISQEILTSIVDKLHKELSSCVRKVSLGGGTAKP